MNIISLDGLRNTRDIGGYTNKEGKKLVENKFFRSCELSKTNKRTKKILLNEYNIKTIIDFRTDVELRKKPIPKMNGIKIYHLPILEDADLGIPRNFKQFRSMWKVVITNNVPADDYMVKMYLSMAFSDYSTKMYRDFFNILLENPSGGILYNCTEGKDRTGLATMLLMLCLNFDKETIMKDYMTSKSFCDIKMRAYYRRCKMLCVGKKIRNFIVGIMTTKEIFINAIFEKIEQNYKTIENYLIQKIQLTFEDIQKLREMYLV